MMDDELMNRFDRIEDLPISEEMLGAYLEGRLSSAERELVQSEINLDLTLMNLSHSVKDYVDQNIFCDSSLIDSIELPILIDEHPIMENSYLEDVPLMDSTDTDFSFELPDIEEDNFTNLDNDVTNE